jgi:hypothetical protein
LKIFLVDYENTNSNGLKGISKLDKSDRVIIFYSSVSSTISFEVLDEILLSGVSLEKIFLKSHSTNALDFQLVTYMGYLIAENNVNDIYVITKDKGFFSAIEFCNKYLKKEINIFQSINEAIGTKEDMTKPVIFNNKKAVLYIKKLIA